MLKIKGGGQDRTQDLLEKPPHTLPTELAVFVVMNMQALDYKRDNVSYFEFSKHSHAWAPDINVRANQKP